jgi:hypothetical protein
MTTDKKNNTWSRRFAVVAVLAALLATGGVTSSNAHGASSADGIPRCC